MGLLLILFVAFFFGSSQGAKTARSEVGSHYRQKKAERNKGAETAGVSAGALMSTTAHSLGVAGRGFAKGWREGWPKGREWVVDRMNRRRRPADEPPRKPEAKRAEPSPAVDEAVPESRPRPVTQKTAPPATAPAPQQRKGAAGTPTNPEAAPAKPGLAPVHDITSLKKTHPTRNGGVLTMPVTTTTDTAEVTNHTQLLAALEAIANEASAEADDASAGLTRANQEVSNIETMTAGLAELELDDESLGKIQALMEPFKQRADSAEQRLAAAEQTKAMAEDAKETVTSKHQVMKEAHDATPEAANKAYYQGD